MSKDAKLIKGEILGFIDEIGIKKDLKEAEELFEKIKIITKEMDEKINLLGKKEDEIGQREGSREIIELLEDITKEEVYCKINDSNIIYFIEYLPILGRIQEKIFY